MDKASILADPTDASTLGEISFKDGTAVCIPTVLYRPPSLFLDKLNKFLHARGEDIMIVVAPGIGGDFTLSLPSPGGRGIRGGKNEYGFAFRKDFARVCSAGA